MNRRWVSLLGLVVAACGAPEQEFAATGGGADDGAMVLSIGARVCFSEMDLATAQLQEFSETARAPEKPCFTAGAEMLATVVRVGEEERHALVTLDGVAGQTWVMRDALRRADVELRRRDRSVAVSD